MEQENEPVEVGKWADMLVLNYDLDQLHVSEIDKTEVPHTLFKGEIFLEVDTNSRVGRAE